MGLVRLAALAWMAVCGPIAFAGPFESPATYFEDGRALQREQLQDDFQREVLDKYLNDIRKELETYRSKEVEYGDVAGQRMAKDGLEQLKRARTARDEKRNAIARECWQTLSFPSPLRDPLPESRVGDLRTFVEVFGRTSLGQVARQLEAEHVMLVSENRAREMLAQLGLTSPSQELSESQFQGLVQIDKEFSRTGSAAAARRYLQTHFDRLSLQRFEGLKAPDRQLTVELNLETLAEMRLRRARKAFGHVTERSRLAQALTGLLQDYPGTVAATQAQDELLKLNAEIAAETARSRSVRDYWDAAYPSRLPGQISQSR